MGEEWATKYHRLGEQLGEVPAVRATRPGSDEDPAQWKLAHALADIDDACAEYAPALQRLLSAQTPEQIADALGDVYEVLRHMTYHLVDPPYLRALVEHQLGEIKNGESVDS
jgi:hypothetical protein